MRLKNFEQGPLTPLRRGVVFTLPSAPLLLYIALAFYSTPSISMHCSAMPYYIKGIASVFYYACSIYMHTLLFIIIWLACLAVVLIIATSFLLRYAVGISLLTQAVGW